MTILDEEVTDVAFHSEEARVFGVVPGEANAGIFLAFPVLCDGVMLLQDGAEVLGVVLASVFNTEVVNDE